MPRIKRGVATRRRKKRVLERASGFRGGRGKLIRSAEEAVNKALSYSYRDRRAKKARFQEIVGQQN